jgi:hypothetical protein
METEPASACVFDEAGSDAFGACAALRHRTCASSLRDSAVTDGPRLLVGLEGVFDIARGRRGAQLRPHGRPRWCATTRVGHDRACARCDSRTTQSTTRQERCAPRYADPRTLTTARRLLDGDRGRAVGVRSVHRAVHQWLHCTYTTDACGSAGDGRSRRRWTHWNADRRRDVARSGDQRRVARAPWHRRGHGRLRRRHGHPRPALYVLAASRRSARRVGAPRRCEASPRACVRDHRRRGRRHLSRRSVRRARRRAHRVVEQRHRRAVRFVAAVRELASRLEQSRRRRAPSRSATRLVLRTTGRRSGSACRSDGRPRDAASCAARSSPARRTRG